MKSIQRLKERTNSASIKKSDINTDLQSKASGNVSSKISLASVQTADNNDVIKDKQETSSASTIQAYLAPYKETIAVPNGSLMRVVHPAREILPESKRSQTIEAAENNLDADVEDLKRAAHEYNVEFQSQVDAVKLRGKVWEENLLKEQTAMTNSMQELFHRVDNELQEVFLVLEQKSLNQFAKIESQEVVKLEKELQQCTIDAKTFFFTTLPEIMEKLQGTITRKLEKNYETFDIENAKTQKREKKTMHVLESNETRTKEYFETETSRRVAKFQEREEDWHQIMRTNNRAIERVQSQDMLTLQSLHQQLTEEAQVRKTEDIAILDHLAAAFHHLQSSILESLGDSTTT